MINTKTKLQYSIKTILLLSLTLFFSCQKSSKQKENITVGILPVKYFVEKIAGQQFKINVTLPPGQSPATYEPLPKQMEMLNHALVYFRIGLPFEKKWLNKIASANKNIKVVDLTQGIILKNKKKHFQKKLSYSNHFDDEQKNEQDKQKGEQKKTHEHGENDPHVWLNPFLVKQMAQMIYENLSDLKPNQEQIYKKNLNIFLKELDKVSSEISNQLKHLKQREIFVFHPAWGYFCDAFDLKQIAIEKEGKSPTAKELISVLNILKEKKAKTIFVQPEFNYSEIKTIAREINADVVKINPLAEHYLENLRDIADKIKAGLE